MCWVQADLIGAERDGKRDEKMHAKLHAAWLEQQDTARVEALLHGVKNGFRRKRSALDDEASAAAPEKMPSMTSCPCPGALILWLRFRR